MPDDQAAKRTRAITLLCLPRDLLRDFARRYLSSLDRAVCRMTCHFLYLICGPAHVAIQYYGTPPRGAHHILHLAMKGDYLELYVHLLESKRYTWPPSGSSELDTCAEAGWLGSARVLSWMRQRGRPWDTGRWLFSEETVRGGHFTVLKWAWEQGAVLTEACVEIAIGRDRLDIVQWLVEERGLGFDLDQCGDWLYNAMYSKQLPSTTEWLVRHFAKEGDIVSLASIGEKASHYGIIELLQLLVERDLIQRDDAAFCHEASRGYHVETLAWLRERDFAWDPAACFASLKDPLLPFGPARICAQWIVDNATHIEWPNKAAIRDALGL